MHGMVPPEFAHWLKHTDAGRAANPKPSSDNVVFRAAPGAEALSLKPPLAPGGDSTAVPRGSVVKASTDRGWSWYDVMVSVTGHMQTQYKVSCCMARHACTSAVPTAHTHPCLYVFICALFHHRPRCQLLKRMLSLTPSPKYPFSS